MTEEDEYSSEEIFASFVDLRELLESIDGKIDATYLKRWFIRNLDLRHKK